MTDQETIYEAKEKANLAFQAIEQHMTSCDKVQVNAAARMDKIEGSVGRLHDRLDKLMYGVGAAIIGMLVQIVLLLWKN